MNHSKHLALVFTGLLASCSGGLPRNDGGVSGSCSGDFGATAEAQRLEAFIAASVAFSGQVESLDNDLRSTCTSMARDLGIADAELQPMAGQTATQAACDRVAREIATSVTAIRAEAGVQLYVEYQPPVCTVNVQAYSDCVAQCDVTYMPGMSTLQCEGGELRGTCSATCSGRCAVSASGMCAGSCEGTCSGSCTGVCQGQCEGTCMTRDAHGNCNGQCMGTCRGTCSAGCTGTCMGSCVAMASGMCSGECRGSCSVAFMEPRCTGTVTPPMANADCTASCDARVNADARCTEPSARLALTGTVTVNAMRAERLRTAIQNHYGRLLQLNGRLVAIGRSTTTLVQASTRVPSAVGSLGLLAGTCATQAANAVTQAVSRVQVSAQVSVRVTASVSGTVM